MTMTQDRFLAGVLCTKTLLKNDYSSYHNHFEKQFWVMLLQDGKRADFPYFADWVILTTSGHLKTFYTSALLKNLDI